MKKILCFIISSILLISCGKTEPKIKSAEKNLSDKTAVTKRPEKIKNKLNIIKITSDKDFSSFIINRAEPAVVLFYSEKSAPGVLTKKTFETVATNTTDNILFAEVNLFLSSSEPIGSKYSIFSIPTLVLFKNGKEVDRLVGKTDINTLKALIKK